MTEKDFSQQEMDQKIRDLQSRLDASESKIEQLEQELERHEHIQEAVFDNSEDAILISDENAIPVAFNRAYARAMKALMNIEMEPGLQPHKFLKNEQERQWWEAMHQRVLSGESFSVDFESGEFEGRPMKFAVSYTPIVKNGKVVGFCEYTKDITDPAQKTRSLHETLERMNVITEHSLDMISRQLPDGSFSFVSPSVKTIHGYEPEELVGKSPYEFLHPDDIPNVKKLHEEFLAGTDVMKSRHRFRNKDGSYNWMESLGKPLYDRETGAALEMIIISRDVSERMQMEQRLMQSESCARSLLNFPTVSNVLIDMDGHLLEINDVAAKGNNSTREEMIGKIVFDFFPPEVAARRKERLQELLRTGKEMRFLDKRGETILDACMMPIKDDKGQIFRAAILAIDITDRIETERKLRESESQARELLDTPFTAAFLLDREGRVLDVNAPGAEVMGYSREELIGNIVFDFMPPEVRELRLEKLDEILEQKEQLIYEDRSNGRIEQVRVFPLFDEDGEVKRVGVVANDITKLVEALEEKQSLLEQLHQSQKMEAIGQLAGGVAHDFNNLLAVIMGGAEILDQKIPGDEKNKKRIKRILNAAERGRDLTNRLLSFSRREKLEVNTVGVSSLIDDVIDMVSMKKIDDIHIRKQIQDDMPQITLDTGQIVQTLLNISLNACDAMPDGGELLIEARVKEKDAMLQGDFRGLNPGKYCELKVSDTGCGVSDELKERVFEPFFTTKEKGKGTGLGLSVALGIVQNHGGVMTLEDNAGGAGTTVRIMLPINEVGAERQSFPAEDGKIGSIAGTVLIIDDEEEYLETFTDCLETENFNVFRAGGGKDGVEIFSQHKDEIDVVLLDMIMPEMGGSTTFKALQEIDPEVKVIICSGFSKEGKATSLLEQGAAAFIRKPFSIDELMRRIATLI